MATLPSDLHLPNTGPPPPAVPDRADGPGVLLDLALEATTDTGAALMVPDGDPFLILFARGANAPARDERPSLAGSVTGKAWYRARLITGPEPPPRGAEPMVRR